MKIDEMMAEMMGRSPKRKKLPTKKRKRLKAKGRRSPRDATGNILNRLEKKYA